ncbi:hypothetical protein RND81_10G207800 [Saponaria officinalis]|uniref:Homeobox domain-containing protein n=1 Tax=Saponaria officinalis TaxID=3572 RepID=A0AAW1I703_SAPOF
MTGYKEVFGEELNLGYPLYQRIHNPRPLIPKSYLNSSYLNRLPHHHHNLGTNKGDEGNNHNNNSKDNVTVSQVMVSSRWNPTPEQLTALEELYRCGTRTPSAEQIQHITAQLGRYGKIEGKNVFYWFQNHKARERQKRRRQLTSTTTIHANHSRDNAHKGQGAAKIGFQDDEKSCKRAPFINNKEYDPPIESEVGTRKADKSKNSSNYNECLQFHETCAQLQHNNNLCQNHTNNPFILSQHNTNVNNNNNNNIISTTNNNVNINVQQPSLELNVSAKTTSCVTLQLFPLLEQDDVNDDDDDDLKMKKDIEIVPSLVNNDDERIMSCMDSTDFVPYYQFL